MINEMRTVVSDLNLSMKELFDYCALYKNSDIELICRRLDKRIMKLLYVYSINVLGDE